MTENKMKKILIFIISSLLLVAAGCQATIVRTTVAAQLVVYPVIPFSSLPAGTQVALNGLPAIMPSIIGGGGSINYNGKKIINYRYYPDVVDGHIYYLTRTDIVVDLGDVGLSCN
jgi:hypothetical protein